MRIPTTTRISELWPSVAKIAIETHQTYRSAFGVYERDTPGRYDPDFAAEFLFDCINTDCTVGYFDLFPSVAGMALRRETHKSGTMECRGNEAPDHSNRCPCVLEYKITIEYND